LSKVKNVKQQNTPLLGDMLDLHVETGIKSERGFGDSSYKNHVIELIGKTL